MWIKQRNIFNQHHAQVPVVDSFGKYYRIYYSTRLNGKSLPMFLDVNKKTFQITNKSEKPLLDLGKLGSFDWAGVMPTEVITVGDLKYLYYIGWSLRQDVPYHNNLGLAVSKDGGNSWEKYSSGPIFSTCAKEPGYIGTVSILRNSNEWNMWYLSCREWIEHEGRMEPTYDVRLAVSQNGIDWNPKSDEPIIALENEEGGISSARVSKLDNGKYVMYFSVRNKINYRTNKQDSYRIKSATSMDAITWKRNPEVIIDVSKSGWDDFMTCYPYIIESVMFYNGNEFGKTGIGYAAWL